MRATLLAVAVAAVLIGAIAGCGRKGAPEAPPASRIEAPSEAVPA